MSLAPVMLVAKRDVGAGLPLPLLTLFLDILFIPSARASIVKRVSYSSGSGRDSHLLWAYP